MAGLAAVAAVLLAGCGIAGPSPGSHAIPAAPADVTSIDPCTLLNLQQQSELGGVNVVQPGRADPPDTACVYLHEGAPRWAITITVGPDRGSKSGVSTAVARPEEINVDSFPATRQKLPDGCIVEVETGRAAGFAVRATGQPSATACPLATHAAELTATTVRRRH